ncbi:DUF1499 domain-containing protein [Argonema galeatum]|uniref:DUF1499 domain-containing protein n=1 Tax=Argonema galeatum TaxID=2942762 RepID=UPI002011D7D3|nr:DUF1499 domain-containing protein [Argonema galeatum]MCL1463219.1 DUF1499 domain-containing protein [Argonema galeatum A003/A1]
MVESSVEKRSPLRLLVIILLSLLLATVFWLGATVAFPGGMTMFAGKRPTNIGVQAGKLADCPSSPNCVSSQSLDAEHKIEPLTYNSTTVEAMAQLKKVIESEERTKIISATSNYLYAEFATKLMGFVDDVEFYLDEAAKVIHVRSASRLGQSDLGVNRKRIETIRAKFNELKSNS